MLNKSREAGSGYAYLNKQAVIQLMVVPKSMLLMLSLGAIAYADDVEETMLLEAITVTAEKRDAAVIDIASSISAKTEAELQDAEISNITELGQHTPNLHIFTWGGRRENNIYMRGIGPGLFTDPTVGVYVDGVNLTTNGMFDLDLADVERVEVLRGPQGTLYGGNSLGGIINVITKKPSNETEGKVSLTLDDLERRKLTANGNTPFIENKLFFGASLSVDNNEGYLDNIYNNETFGAREDLVAKFKLRFLPNERLESNLIVDFERLRGDSYAMGPAATVKENPDQINHDFKGVDDRDAYGISLSLTWKGDTFDFTSVTGWRDWDNVNSADQDTLSDPTFVFHSKSDETQSQLSQELRWASNQRENKWQWLGGLYAYRSEYEVQNRNDLDYTAFGFGGPYIDLNHSKKDNSGYAVFGQTDYRLTDNLTITAGLRLDRETREADINTNNQSAPSVSIQGDKTFTEWLPKVGLSYDLDDALLYASVSKGYRAGGFDFLYPNETDATYDSETSINYELGYKSTFLDNRLELSATLFYISIEDQQVQQLIPATGNVTTDNAGEGRSRGIEFESRYKPALGWLVSFAGSYTDAEYKEYDNCDFTGVVSSCSGNRMINTPRLTLNLGVQNRYSLTDSLDLFTRLDVQHLGSYYFDALNKFEQESYQLVNFKIGLEAESWDAYFWVKNALDEYYSSVEFDFGSGHAAEAGDPRAIGLTVNARF